MDKKVECFTFGFSLQMGKRGKTIFSSQKPYLYYGGNHGENKV